MNNYNGKRAFITGSTSGIGRDLAIRLASYGCSIIIHGSNLKRAEETLSQLSGSGHTICILDFTTDLQAGYKLNEIGKIDFFINNAGITHSSTLRNLNLEKMNDVFRVNLFSPINLLHEFLKLGLINTNASLVFTTSVAGKNRFSVGNVIYGVSKAAIEGFAKGVAAQLAELKIRINCVAPALINTNFNQSTSISKEQYDQHSAEYPLKRIGETVDVVNAILFYLNQENNWITGTTLDIDGGLSIKNL